MYKNLVFKGGGVKIYASLGAIESLCDHGILDNVERVAGSSAGALMALIVSLNMHANEAKEFVTSIDLKKEMDVTDVKEKTQRFFEEFGMYTGSHVRETVKNLLEEKTGNADITFLEFHEKGFKDLYVTGTNLYKKELTVFSYEETPHVKIIDAIEVSGSYPIFFVPRNIDGDLYLDGGLINNYPVEIFDDEKYLPKNCNTCKHNPETLGVFLGSPDAGGAIIENIDDLTNIIHPFDEMDKEITDKELEKLDYSVIINEKNGINSILDLIVTAFRITANAKETNYSYENAIIIELDHNINALKFDLSTQEIESLIENGKLTTDSYIDSHHDNFFQEFSTCICD